MAPRVTPITLVERDEDISVLRALLEEAATGRGAVAIVEGPAGQGKTTLLRALAADASAAGTRALSATGIELERDFAFGVVRQLFEAELLGASAERRAALLRGAAALAAPIFEAAAEEPAAASHVRRHALFWLAANLAEESPLLLLVDDAHWADAASLEVLVSLAVRIADLPVVLAVGMRPSEPGAEQALLHELARAPGAQVVRPGALTRAGVRELAREALGGEPAEAFVDACVETTRGNPLLVRELLRAAAEHGMRGGEQDAARAREMVPGTIVRTVVGRLRRLSPVALAVAHALAVLGDGSRQDVVAALAGLSAGELAAEHDALASAGLLGTSALSFTHPMVRQAVAADLVATERAAWHARAAQLVRDAGGDDAAIAAHLLLSEPAGEPWAARALAAVGERALRDGAPAAAARQLRRALAEPPEAEDRPRMLLALGRAELAAGEPAALDRLAEAVGARDVGVAVAAERARTGLLVMAERRPEAAAGLRQAIARAAPVDAALAADLEDDLLDAVQYDARLLQERSRLLAGAAGSGRPARVAHLALERALAGAPADEVLAHARGALAGGELLRARGAESVAFGVAVEALLVAEAADEAAAAIAQAAEVARRSGSRLGAAYVAAVRTQWEWLFGDLRRAEDEARHALELFVAPGRRPGTQPTMPALAAALLDRGELDEAERVVLLFPEDPREPPRGLYARAAPLRARVHLARGRPEAALEELAPALELERVRGWALSPRDDVHALRVAALAAAGRGEEALAAAAARMELERARGARGALAAIGLASARALEGEAAIAALEDAVAAARSSPRRHVLAQALGELGAALRRAGRRTAAREPLREARELAALCGARGLEERVLEELVVAGARPQRVALSGLDALTAAERRVAGLAADGLRNREIAEALFVTLKTVEVHLARTYAKLGIRGRAELRDALGV